MRFDTFLENQYQISNKRHKKDMDISVVVPLFNEEESIAELHSWIKRVMDENHFTYEVVFVNDGSTDKSWDVIEGLCKEYPEVHGIKFRRNYGKSPALYHGFERAQGDVVITMDADLQDSPDEIPSLYKMIKEEGYDLVSGFKMNRRQGDPLSKTIPTKLFNATTRMVSGIHNLHDFNCGLKAYRKDVVKHIEVYGEMHRFIPYLAKNAGFSKIGEKPVHHQARQHGVSKFMGWNRFVNGYLDLISLWFIDSFGMKPMHMFGFVGTLMFIIGFVEFFATHRNIVGINLMYFPSAIIEMVGYLCMTLLASLLLRLVEKKMDGSDSYELVQADSLTMTAGTYSHPNKGTPFDERSLSDPKEGN